MFPGGFVFLSCDYSDHPFRCLLHAVSLLFALDFLANTLPGAGKGIQFFFSVEDALTSSNYPLVQTGSDFFGLLPS